MGSADQSDKDLTEELTVYDTEVHTSETWEELMEYIDDDELREREQGGYGNAPESWGPIPWDGWDRTNGGKHQYDLGAISKAEDYEETRQQFNIDKVIFSPGTGFKIFQIPDARARVGYMRAMNNFTLDRFVRDDDTYYAKVLIVPDHPEESAAEIERIGSEDGIVSVFMADLGLQYPLGHKRYEPIYEAAEKHDLPITLHGDSSVYAGWPTDGLNFNTFLELHTLVHPLTKLWHATSIIGQGIPERYDIDWCFLEAGQSWVQMLANRMDREFMERSNDAPELTKLPSEYLSDFYYGSQPLEEPQNSSLGDIIEQNNLEDSLVMATDWPHHDFDSTASVSQNDDLTREQKVKILQDNPAEIYGV
ncbi:amidohydrolase family protein [Natrinema soli]|uniref:Amidohydrolase family protein n=1 Tax=Natrinema soli TaxID=1930624 RepID=A0ABD5SL87_9EURY|nr:amidohydrolase family protein [Natrinema soli]